MPYIYKIENKINGKVYIGATTQCIDDRWRQHLYECSRSGHRPLYKAMNRYGKDNFSLTIVEETDNLEERERYWIEQYRSFKNGYNATTGGSGKPYIDYDIVLALWKDNKNIKEIHHITGYDCSALSKVLDNLDVTNEERFLRGQLVKQRPIAMLDKNTKEILRVFSSLREAHDFLGKQQNGHIASACDGNRQTAYGYCWKRL